MKIWEKIKSWFRRKTANQEVGFERLAEFLGIDPDISKDAMSETTYFACQKILSESIGKMSFKLLRYTDKNGVEAMRNDPVYTCIHDRPNPYMNASTFWSTMELFRNHYGNAFAWIQGAGTKQSPYRLWILPPEDVSVIYDDGMKLASNPDVYYVYSGNGEQYVLKSDEVIHVKTSTTKDGILGVPVRKQLADTLQGSIKSQKLLNKLYENGFTAKTVLNYTGNLSDANVQKLVNNLAKYTKSDIGEGGMEKIIPIPVGFNLTPLNTKLTDNQFLEIKQFTAGQISAAFGIKPYQYNDLSKSSYASGEQQQLAFYVDTLLYIIKQYEEEVTYKLLTESKMQRGYHCKFNVGSILRTDLEKQIQTLSTGVTNGIYSPNEARNMLDLESRDGGDRLYVNGNAIPLDMIGMQYAASTGKEETTDGQEI